MANENYSSDVQIAVDEVMQKQKKAKRKKRLIVLAVIVVIIIAFFAILSGGDSDGEGSNPGGATEVTMSTEQLKASAKDIPYKDLARDPDSYKNQVVHFTGEVIQVIESSYGPNEYRVAVTKDEFGGYDYDDIVYLTYKLNEGESRILEDDVIEFYGTYKGLMSYESTLGGKITVPEVEGQYAEIIK